MNKLIILISSGLLVLANTKILTPSLNENKQKHISKSATKITQVNSKSKTDNDYPLRNLIVDRLSNLEYYKFEFKSGTHYRLNLKSDIY